MLEQAVRAGVTSLGLEWKGRELMVFQQADLSALVPVALPRTCSRT